MKTAADNNANHDTGNIVPEDLHGIDANPPLTKAELIELGKLIDKSKAGALTPEETKRVRVLVGRYKHLG